MTPPPGLAARPLWRLDPEFVTVNHGSFGATPIAVLADRLGTETGIAPPMAGAMGLVRLPLATATGLRARLLAAVTDAPIHVIDGGVWLPLSAFAYNAPEDYVRLGDILTRVVGENTP